MFLIGTGLSWINAYSKTKQDRLFTLDLFSYSVITALVIFLSKDNGLLVLSRLG